MHLLHKAAYLLGDLLANRTYFTGQHVTRDRKRVDATPDHIFFQLWRSGGYTGQIEGRSITVGAGTVALSDRRRTLDVRFAPSDTIGLVVPLPPARDRPREPRASVRSGSQSIADGTDHDLVSPA
ncbi:hypothetical protein [Methylobacterium sp. D54C]